MGKKNEEVRMKDEEIPEEIMDEGKTDTSLVYDLSTLFEMKFRDPLNGQIVMVRRAFKPRGKLEFYCPEE